MTSVLARAAREFLNDERKRPKRPRFSEGDRVELEYLLKGLEDVSREDAVIHGIRGLAAVRLIGYQGVDSGDAYVNVIADVLTAAEAAGEDALTVLAHARAEFYRDKGVDDGS